MRSALVIAWLAAQLAIPLGYYVDPDPMDERFAWRMFSPVRMVRCSVRVEEAPDGVRRPVRLSQELHTVWINLLKRGRPAVVQQLARQRCGAMDARGEQPALYVDLACVLPDGEVHRPVPPDRDLCGDAP